MSEQGFPLCCGGIEFTDLFPENSALGFFYLGPKAFWWRRYPGAGIRATKTMFERMRAWGVKHMFLVLDEKIEGSETMARFLGGKHVQETLWVVDTDNARF